MDIRIVPQATADVVTMDWLQSPVTGLVEETAELETAVIVAICSDALADPSDVLPDPNSTDRRGWWGDEDAQQIWGGWPVGSKLWLLTRAKILTSSAREGSTLARVQSYISQCIQPFVTAGICSRFKVSAQQVNAQRIRAKVVMYRGPKTAIDLEFLASWDELFPGA